jgi:hypothetical protein
MNNIQEKDWAEEGWNGHTGMDTFSDYSIAGDKADEGVKDAPEAATDPDGSTEQAEQE